jgi:hypothetical protein
MDDAATAFLIDGEEITEDTRQTRHKSSEVDKIEKLINIILSTEVSYINYFLATSLLPLITSQHIRSAALSALSVLLLLNIISNTR